MTSACEARIWPIGDASGGQPASARTRPTSASTSSSRSPAAWARRWRSSAATSPAGRSCSAARDGDPRSERHDRLVADVLVDEVAGLPERFDVDTGRRRRGPSSDSRERLARDAVEGQRERIDGAGDQVGACLDGRERRREAVPAAPWQ